MYFLVQGLVNGDYDVVMGDLTIDSERLDVIDFSIPIQMADLVIMKKQSSSLDADMFAIAQPFSLHVWIAILGSGLLATLQCYAEIFLVRIKYFFLLGTRRQSGEESLFWSAKIWTNICFENFVPN